MILMSCRYKHRNCDPVFRPRKKRPWARSRVILLWIPHDPDSRRISRIEDWRQVCSAAWSHCLDNIRT